MDKIPNATRSPQLDRKGTDTPCTTFGIAHWSFLLARYPLQAVPKQSLVRWKLMRLSVVPQSNAHDSRFRMLGNPHHRISLAGTNFIRRCQNLDRRSHRVWLEMVKLVIDIEVGGHTVGHRMCRVGEIHFKLAVLVMAARSAAAEHA